MKKYKLSIIIPVYNEEKDIEECLKSLKKQSCKNFEIIIVDDGSSDRTVEIVKKFKGIRLIKSGHKGPGFSRNLGAEKSSGEILIFIDADMTFDRNYFKNLIKPIINDKTGKIIGTTHELEMVKNINNIWSRCWGKIRVSKEEAGNVKIFRAIKKSVFLRLGGFDSKYGYADDQTFWFKYKIKPVVAENTMCYHKNPSSLKAVFKQSRWIGASHSLKITDMPILNLIYIIIMFILSPVAIPLLSIKKCIKNKDFLIFPYMLVFMAARYMGTLKGYSRKIFFKINTR